MSDKRPENSLFREEAMAASSSNTMGKVLLRQPREYRWYAMILAGIVLFSLVLLFTGEYGRHARVFGVITVDKGLVKVTAIKEGRVAQQVFDQGQLVDKGDLLYVISTTRHSSTDKDLDASLLERQKSLQTSMERDLELARNAFDDEMALLEGKIKARQQEIAHLDEQLGIYGERLELSQQGIARNQKLLKAGHVNQVQIDNLMEAHLSLKTRLSELKMKRSSSLASLDELQVQLRLKPDEFDEKENRLQRTLIENRQRIADISANIDYQIYAPSSGVIGGQYTHTGEFIRKGNVLATLIPKGSQLQAELYVPADAIGFIQSGQTVAMRYSAFPYQHFGVQNGQVVNVSKVISLPEELETSIKLEGAVYKVTVAIESQSINAKGDDIPLEAGMELEASIKLEKRSLMQWILDPIYSLRDS
ncbi:HlyD family efflux transporter periplasmic adaptor subunit [Shewanella corallii]|uniref:HlyD family efflux transporter periplasmic adaptor subunit n=1 Tax=Shewanella corallii TaxID=560080 RepID=A0ABT0N942_9GAMM|nr:HlyD family efflux transporter periplasmic adaptor subunit [Shewanella corallii]MCL2914998.1 HlyD family efflux transporter periplasmic adaptor subunit [Shewanella corallii]